MTCKNCGKSINEKDKFCPNCGSTIENTKQEQNNILDLINNNDKMDTIILIISIVSLIISCFGIKLSLVFAIISITLGILLKNKSGKKKLGITFSILSIVIITVYSIIRVVVNTVTPETAKNDIVGTWNCSNYNSRTSDYSITMKLNKDGSFIFGPYGDLTNNYAKGNYTYEELKEKNETSEQYKYYTLQITAQQGDYVVDGVKQDRVFDAKFEMGITTAEPKQALLMNYRTYQTYKCNLEK